MRLKQLIKTLDNYQDSGLNDFEVKGVTCDSKSVASDFIFVAIKGAKDDGHKFINEAIGKGAKAILTQGTYSDFKITSGVSLIEVLDTRQALAQLASEFYSRPSEKIKVIGITGTNGKTTITYLAEAMLKEAGYNPGVIGTVNYRFGDKVFPSKNTTPGPHEIQPILAQMLKEGVDYTIMEVSSHALDQGRIAGINFHSAIFTNLTQDHLDYHLNLENYFQAKAKLFKNLGTSSFAVINNDDSYGIKIKALTKAPVITYGIDTDADVVAQGIKFDIGQTEFFIRLRARCQGCKPVDECGQLALRRMSLNKLKGGPAEAKRRRVISGTTAVKPWGSIESNATKTSFKTPLIGRYNVYNILAAVAWGKKAGLELSVMKSAIAKFSCVPGRLEKIDFKGDFTVFVDYAHTEDALRNVLNALRQISSGRIIVVFGCGGDRDKTKRPKMGKVVTELADYAIITSDNPRSEEPQDIVNDIKSGIAKHNYGVVLERKDAIYQALSLAKPGDIVLVAGKGHENCQIIKDKVIPFDDRKIVKECLKSLKS